MRPFFQWVTALRKENSFVKSLYAFEFGNNILNLALVQKSMALSEGDRMQAECMTLYDLTDGILFTV